MNDKSDFKLLDHIVIGSQMRCKVRQNLSKVVLKLTGSKSTDRPIACMKRLQGASFSLILFPNI